MFRYHNEILRTGMEKLLNTFRDVCDGRDISIGSLVKDKDGHYSDEKLNDLISELVMADYSQADMYNYCGTDRYEREKDYLSTLLYVVIRASQAGLNRVREGGDVVPIRDDSFAAVLTAFREHYNFFPTVVSGSMKATVETVYMLLSGKKLGFPDPYLKSTLITAEKEKEKETVQTSDDTPAEEEEIFDDEQMYVEEDDDFDEDRDLIFGWDDDLYTEEEKEAIYLASVTAAIRDEELEDYYKGDAKSREDYDNYYPDDADERWLAKQRERNKKYSLGDPDDEESRELYENEKKRLLIFFAAKQEFIKKYEHLYEITTTEDKEFIKNIEAKINSWLKDHDKTLYMNDEDYRAVYESLYAAVGEARMRQVKNK